MSDVDEGNEVKKIAPRQTSGLSLSDLNNVEGFEQIAIEDTLFGFTLNKYGNYKRKEINIPNFEDFINWYINWHKEDKTNKKKKVKWLFDIGIDNLNINFTDLGDGEVPELFNPAYTLNPDNKELPIVKAVRNRGIFLGTFYPEFFDNITIKDVIKDITVASYNYNLITGQKLNNLYCFALRGNKKNNGEEVFEHTENVDGSDVVNVEDSVKLIFTARPSSSFLLQSWDDLSFGIKIILHSTNYESINLVPGLIIRWKNLDSNLNNKIWCIYKTRNNIFVYLDGEEEPTDLVEIQQNYRKYKAEIRISNKLCLIEFKATYEDINIKTLKEACDF